MNAKEERLKILISDLKSVRKQFENDFSVRLGQQLLQIRKENNFVQADLALLLKVPTSTYANWEQGRREPDIYNLIMLSKIFQITIDELLDF